MSRPTAQRVVVLLCLMVAVFAGFVIALKQLARVFWVGTIVAQASASSSR